MKFVGIRKDEQTQELVKYELNLNREDIQCLYKDRYGAYICTKQGRMYKVDLAFDALRLDVGL